MMVSSSKGMFDGRCGTVPVAITMALARYSAVWPGDVGHPHRVRIQELREPADHLHPVARQLVLDDLDLVADGDVQPLEQVRRRDVRLHPVAAAVDALLAPAAEVEHGLAQRLAGDRAGVGGDAADDLPALDDGGALAQLRCLDGGALAAGSAADDQQVEGFHEVMSRRSALLYRSDLTGS